MKTHIDDRLHSEQYGITKLEFFTAAALTGLLANPCNYKSDIGAMAVNKDMECINELNAKNEMDKTEVLPAESIDYNDDDDLPW
jgi:hypothetical protein